MIDYKKLIKEKIKLVTECTDESLATEFDGMSLTGAHYRLDHIQLAYLFYEVQKELNIKFDLIRLENYEFNTIEKINFLINDVLENDN